MDSKSYCVLPYNHLSIDPVGQVRPCCNYNFFGKDFPRDEWPFRSILDTDNIDVLMGAKPHSVLRDDIENNQLHKFCNRCWVQEDNGGRSYRQDWNDRFIKDQFQTQVKIEYLEMTLGNKCNIACRMCNPWASSLWETAVQEHPEIDIWGGSFDNINFEWYNHPNFDRILEQVLPTLKHINMLGGEPLFNAKYYEILERIIASGRANEITLQFNTNLLALQSKNLDLWKHFKQVTANISADGVARVNEYVRYPGKWSKFLRNLNTINEWQQILGVQDDQQKLVLQIHSTMSSLTWLNLGDLFQWTQTLPWFFKFPFLIQVNQPSYLDCIHMPEEIKQLGYDRAIAGLNGVDSWETKNIHSLLNHVMNTSGDPDQWQQMIQQSQTLDKVRKQNILDIIPEFANHWG